MFQRLVTVLCLACLTCSAAVQADSLSAVPVKSAAIQVAAEQGAEVKTAAGRFVAEQNAASKTVSAEHPDDFYRNYKLQKMTILSRHHIRAPLAGKNSFAGRVTPHSWMAWSSAPGELSLRGGELETLMGQYFRKRLVRDGLITENYQPKEGEMRFYANSLQRTIATARYFASGFLPVAEVPVEHKFALGKNDPVFSFELNMPGGAFLAEADREIKERCGPQGVKGVGSGLGEAYKLLEQILDVKQSPAYKEGSFKHFATGDTKLALEPGRLPYFKGSLRQAGQVCDALVLQYYEQPDDLKAGFNHKLTPQDWEKLAPILETSYDLIYAAPVVALSLAHPVLQVLDGELALSSRKFSYICGHDLNVFSVLAALDTASYDLPQTVLKRAPIGVKLVLEKWAGPDGQDYASLSLVYQSTEQLRQRSMLDLEHPPVLYPLTLKGLTKNADGLYKFSDLQARLAQALAAYEALPEHVSGLTKAA